VPGDQGLVRPEYLTTTAINGLEIPHTLVKVYDYGIYPSFLLLLLAFGIGRLGRGRGGIPAKKGVERVA